LNRVNESLKKFAHVNKKALEQYNNFTKQREELIKRREELDASAVSIEELIVTLDQRKDEAIQRTFKQVSKYFEEVFEQLVPSGVGRLIIQKKSDAYRDEETEDSGGPAGDGSEVESYSGVSIKVSCNAWFQTDSRSRSTRSTMRDSASSSFRVAKSRSWRLQLVSCHQALELTLSLRYSEVRPCAVLPV
jgi:hypothetical protein